MWIALAAGTASRSSEGKNQSSGSKRRQSDHYRGDPAVPTLSLLGILDDARTDLLVG
ncbi:MAG TPA: hypothetical protein VGI50_17385 [Solirubrobacteraceae bacterium]